MVERDVEPDDIYRVLTVAETCRAIRPDHWRLEGFDTSAEPLALIAKLRGAVIVVTLFRGDEP